MKKLIALLLIISCIGTMTVSAEEKELTNEEIYQEIRENYSYKQLYDVKRADYVRNEETNEVETYFKVCVYRLENTPQEVITELKERYGDRIIIRGEEEWWDMTGGPLPIKTNPDVNGDGKCNLLDAQYTLKAALGIVEVSMETTDLMKVSYSGNEKIVNLEDAREVLRWALNIYSLDVE